MSTDNVFCILELVQVIVIKAKFFGVTLLSINKQLYNMKPSLKLNVHAVINGSNCDAYKEYDFKNIEYVRFEGYGGGIFVKLELQVPIVYESYITCDDIESMNGKLYTKFISVTVHGEAARKQLLCILDSCKYEYVFVQMDISIPPFALVKPDFEIVIMGPGDNIMCADIKNKKFIIGVRGNIYGEMIILQPDYIPFGKPMCLDNMYFQRQALSNGGLHNLVMSGKKTDLLITQGGILNDVRYNLLVNGSIEVLLSTDLLYIGKNISCKKIALTIFMIAYNPFIHVIIDNDCEYSFSTQNSAYLGEDKLNNRFFSNGVNLLIHLDNNIVVLISGAKHIPIKHPTLLKRNINYIDDDITKANHREIISKYLYDEENLIISDQECGATNDSCIEAYGWCGRPITIHNINTPVYTLSLINDDSSGEPTIISLNESTIQTTLEIFIKCIDFCDNASLVFNTNDNTPDIPDIKIVCTGAGKLTVDLYGVVHVLYRDTHVSSNITMHVQ